MGFSPGPELLGSNPKIQRSERPSLLIERISAVAHINTTRNTKPLTPSNLQRTLTRLASSVFSTIRERVNKMAWRSAGSLSRSLSRVSSLRSPPPMPRLRPPQAASRPQARRFSFANSRSVWFSSPDGEGKFQFF